MSVTRQRILPLLPLSFHLTSFKSWNVRVTARSCPETCARCIIGLHSQSQKWIDIPVEDYIIWSNSPPQTTFNPPSSFFLIVFWPGRLLRSLFYYPSRTFLHTPHITLQSYSFHATFIEIMFAKIALPLLSLSALAGSALALPFNPEIQSLNRRYVSFDNYGSISSFDGFDNFYGVDNFSGEISVSDQVVVQQEVEVCQSVSIEIVQQKLLVLQEIAKRIVTEQICEVETQTVVFQQFLSSSSHFSSDLLRTSGLQVGYDSSIASHFSDMFESDGSLSTSDLGFSGSSLGSGYVVPTGNNWDSSSSPSSVGSAYSAALSAVSA
ncbi:hypothetical protein D9757_011063 [Collybiopsis confluens]|uniref:Uncharacterized protein n=1 Tax=Collybiopsis confluens TaxID=2823264 RepID=A0A8H5GPX5_9AGAR|nr:hypothetical protein D9757_011063 [Collybiopsis confluens]